MQSGYVKTLKHYRRRLVKTSTKVNVGSKYYFSSRKETKKYDGHILKPGQILVVLIAGIDVNHHVSDIGKAAEDKAFDRIGNFVRPSHGHLRVHLQLQINNQVLAGAPPAYFMNPVDTRNFAGGITNLIQD